MDEQVLTQAKPLPATDGELHRTFEANGQQYQWLTLEQIGIRRWTHLSNLLTLLYDGQDSREGIREYHKETTRKVLMAKDLPAAQEIVAVRNQAYIDGITNRSKDRFHLCMTICACICLRKGDDIRRFSLDVADSYALDWTEEGYSYLDFFGMAGSLSADFRDDFRQTQKRRSEEGKQLRGVTDTSLDGSDVFSV